MHSCAEPSCTNWIAFGQKCHKHTTDDELVATFARKPREAEYNEERLHGIGVVRTKEVRVTRRPNVGRVHPWTKVRGGTIALSECIVIRPDGTRGVFGQTPKVDTTTDNAKLRSIARTKDHHDYNEA